MHIIAAGCFGWLVNGCSPINVSANQSASINYFFAKYVFIIIVAYVKRARVEVVWSSVRSLFDCQVSTTWAMQMPQVLAGRTWNCSVPWSAATA